MPSGYRLLQWFSLFASSISMYYIERASSNLKTLTLKLNFARKDLLQRTFFFWISFFSLWLVHCFFNYLQWIVNCAFLRSFLYLFNLAATGPHNSGSLWAESFSNIQLTRTLHKSNSFFAFASRIFHLSSIYFKPFSQHPVPLVCCQDSARLSVSTYAYF